MMRSTLDKRLTEFNSIPTLKSNPSIQVRPNCPAGKRHKNSGAALKLIHLKFGPSRRLKRPKLTGAFGGCNQKRIARRRASIVVVFGVGVTGAPSAAAGVASVRERRVAVALAQITRRRIIQRRRFASRVQVGHGHGQRQAGRMVVRRKQRMRMRSGQSESGRRRRRCSRRRHRNRRRMMQSVRLAKLIRQLLHGH